MVKKIADIFIRFGATHERDGRTDRGTDRHRVTAYTALMHMHRAVKIETREVWWCLCLTTYSVTLSCVFVCYVFSRISPVSTFALHLTLSAFCCWSPQSPSSVFSGQFQFRFRVALSVCEYYQHASLSRIVVDATAVGCLSVRLSVCLKRYHSLNGSLDSVNGDLQFLWG